MEAVHGVLSNESIPSLMAVFTCLWCNVGLQSIGEGSMLSSKSEVLMIMLVLISMVEFIMGTGVQPV